MIVLPVKKSCCTCTEDLTAAAQNSIFFSSGMSGTLSVSQTYGSGLPKQASLYGLYREHISKGVLF